MWIHLANGDTVTDFKLLMSESVVKVERWQESTLIRADYLLLDEVDYWLGAIIC